MDLSQKSINSQGKKAESGYRTLCLVSRGTKKKKKSWVILKKMRTAKTKCVLAAIYNIISLLLTQKLLIEPSAQLTNLEWKRERCLRIPTQSKYQNNSIESKKWEENVHPFKISRYMEALFSSLLCKGKSLNDNCIKK